MISIRDAIVLLMVIILMVVFAVYQFCAVTI